MKLNTSPAPVPPEQVQAESIADGMNRFGRAWRDALNKALDRQGLTLLQWAVLEMVRDHPGLSQVEVATAVGVEGPSLVRVLDGLERQGWVARQIDEGDRRVRRLYIPEGSAARVSRAQSAVDAVQDRVVSGMNESEQVAFRSLLNRAVGTLQAPRSSH